jgi:Flp pilus assembly protein TadD
MQKKDWEKTKPISILIEKGKIAEALAKLDKLIEKTPNDDFLYYYKGLIYQTFDDNETADKWLRKAGEIFEKTHGSML